MRNLNAEIQGRIGHNRPALQYYDDEEGLIDFTATVTGSKFRLDDPILITKNSYDIDVESSESRLAALSVECYVKRGAILVHRSGCVLQL